LFVVVKFTMQRDTCIRKTPFT